MSAGASPPKPWERAAASGGSAAIPTSAPTVAANAAMPSTTVPGSAASPVLPARPDTLNSIASRTASNYSSPYNRASPYSSYSSPYGFGSMGGMGGMNSYSSPYSRFGGMGGMGGMYGGGMYGQDQMSLTQSFGNSTQATFQMIESIVGAFGGFAQMLESTYMATHSSFFAMVSVAEQFGNLKQTLGSVLGIFAILRWARAAIAKITGRPPPADSKELTVANFAAFSGRPGPDGMPAPKPSRKPFIFFVVAVFGLPYLMGKLIRALAASQEAQQQQQQQLGASEGQLDPSKLDFCRVLYDYTPQAQPGQQFQEGIDLAVKKGDLVAVLSKTDPLGNASEWWRCRARDGGMGYLPSPYLETIQRRPPQAQIAAHSAPNSEAGSRLHTMTTSFAGDASRANSMKVTEKEKESVKVMAPPKVMGKPGDVSVESFQRAGFYT